MKGLLYFMVAVLFIVSCKSGNEEISYKDKNLDIKKRVENLLSQMTIQEKVAQLNLLTAKVDIHTDVDLQDPVRKGMVGNILKSNGVAKNYRLQKIAIEETRLGIPLMFHEDVIHGYKTIFPMPMGEAASWNMEIIKKTAEVAAKEAAASGLHLTYAPMVDIGLDPRWGRIVEGAGEDPYLGSMIAKARVEGFQGNSLSDSSTILACAKHFIGYGDALAGRDYNIAEFSERKMHETYLPPFKAAIDAGVESMMVAYTAIDGIPATANKKIIKDLLRNDLGFDGMLITDWETIKGLIKTSVAIDGADASKQAIEAGIDVDMVSEMYSKHLEELVNNGTVDINLLDNAVRRVLKAKFELGLFDDPYKYLDSTREKNVLLHQKHIEIARQAARESMVLLKNKNNALPLKKDIKRIAVIGPLAKGKQDLLSWWGGEFSQGKAEDVVSLYEGIKNTVSQQTEVLYAEGITLDGFEKKGTEKIAEAVKVAKQSDVIILAVGEEYWMSGEGASVSSLDLPGAQNELIEAIHKTGKPVVVVLISGRPYDIRKPVEYFDAVLEAWFPGTMGGAAIADILFGDYNPSGKLPFTYPLCTGQVPIFYNYKKTSHDFAGVDMSKRFINNYLDISTKPLFPFGYGLSYTNYQYSNMSIENNDKFHTVKIDVTNTGKHEGYEVVQLYINDLVSSVITPHKRLKDFARIHLLPNETKTVEFTISKDKLTFIDKEMNEVFEPGEFNIMIGPNSEDLDTLTVFFLL